VKFKSYSVEFMNSNPRVRHDLFFRPLNKVLITDFFGSVQGIELTSTKYPLAAINSTEAPAASPVALKQIDKQTNQHQHQQPPQQLLEARATVQLFSSDYTYGTLAILGLAALVTAVSLVR